MAARGSGEDLAAIVLASFGGNVSPHMRVCAPTPYKYSVGRICVCVLAKCRRKTPFTRIRYMATMAHAVGAAHDVLETLALTPGQARGRSSRPRCRLELAKGRAAGILGRIGAIIARRPDRAAGRRV